MAKGNFRSDLWFDHIFRCPGAKLGCSHELATHFASLSLWSSVRKTLLLTFNIKEVLIPKYHHNGQFATVESIKNCFIDMLQHINKIMNYNVKSHSGMSS